MTLAIAYPHDHRTREPRPMKAREIWGIADEVRQHLLPRRRTPCLRSEERRVGKECKIGRAHV